MQLINIKKIYSDRVIFENFNYTFEGGNMYWLKGENGVGKSTFIRILVGVEKVTEGEIINIPKKILYIPEIEITEKWLTIKENIEFLYNISGIKKEDSLSIMSNLNINESDYNNISLDCSTGTNMKVGFSLIFSREHWDMIILDEAFSHIDIETQNSILEKLLIMSKENNTIIIFTHHDNIITKFKNDICNIIIKKDGVYEEK